MKQYVRIALAVLAVLLGIESVRWFLRVSKPHPTLIEPTTSLHRAIGKGPLVRVARVVEKFQPAPRSSGERLIALTFDDGPYPIYTPMLLDELKRLRIRATFFLIGRDAGWWPQIARRIAADGNEIGDHTQTHPDLDRETPAQVRRELVEGRNTLLRITGDRSAAALFRPPHGRYTAATLRVAQSLGMKTIFWSDDPGDWRDLSAREIEAHVAAHATEPEILLLHSGKRTTVKALEKIVPAFRRAGYRFVTVGEMLALLGARRVEAARRLPVRITYSKE